MAYFATLFVYEALVLLMYMTSNRNIPEINHLSFKDINKANLEVQYTVPSCTLSVRLGMTFVLYKLEKYMYICFIDHLNTRFT